MEIRKYNFKTSESLFSFLSFPLACLFPLPPSPPFERGEGRIISKKHQGRKFHFSGNLPFLTTRCAFTRSSFLIFFNKYRSNI